MTQQAYGAHTYPSQHMVRQCDAGTSGCSLHSISSQRRCAPALWCTCICGALYQQYHIVGCAETTVCFPGLPLQYLQNIFYGSCVKNAVATVANTAIVPQDCKDGVKKGLKACSSAQQFNDFFNGGLHNLARACKKRFCNCFICGLLVPGCMYTPVRVTAT